MAQHKADVQLQLITNAPLLPHYNWSQEHCERSVDADNPGVDFPGVIMEEEHVLDEHGPTTLRHG